MAFKKAILLKGGNMKKILSIILSVVTVFSIISITSFAEYVTEKDVENLISLASNHVSSNITVNNPYGGDKSNYFVKWCFDTAGFSKETIPSSTDAADLYNKLKTSGTEHQPPYNANAGDILFLAVDGRVTDCAIVVSSDGTYITAIMLENSSVVNKKIYSITNARIHSIITPSFALSDIEEKPINPPVTDPDKDKYYVVTASYLNFRETPDSSDSENIITSLPKGTLVKIEKIEGDWGYTTYKGNSGWLSMKYLVLRKDNPMEGSPYAVKWNAIDVSRYQGKIDWNGLLDEGYNSVIIRLGFRYSSSKVISIDNMFFENYKGAKEAGFNIGVYFYSAATNPLMAIEEAHFVYKTIYENNLKLNMPVYFDIEDTVTQNTGKENISKLTKAFLDYMKDRNVFAGVYTNTHWLNNYFEKNVFDDCELWVAEWAEICKYDGKYGMWQYSSKGEFESIESQYTDLNYCYLDYPKIISEKGYNVLTKKPELIGDLDNNGVITAADARIVIRHSAQLDLLPAELELMADFNQNGIITSADARLILRKALKID